MKACKARAIFNQLLCLLSHWRWTYGILKATAISFPPKAETSWRFISAANFFFFARINPLTARTSRLAGFGIYTLAWTLHTVEGRRGFDWGWWTLHFYTNPSLHRNAGNCEQEIKKMKRLPRVFVGLVSLLSHTFKNEIGFPWKRPNFLFNELTER